MSNEIKLRQVLEQDLQSLRKQLSE